MGHNIFSGTTRFASLRQPRLALITLAAAICLHGCALAPNTIRTEIEHLSHATQHLGIASSVCSTNGRCGGEILSVEAHWQRGGWFADVSEGYAVERLDGLHEVFQGKVGYEFRVKP